MGQLTDLEKQLQADLKEQREILKQKEKEAEMLIQAHNEREQELLFAIDKLKKANEEIEGAKRDLQRNLDALMREREKQGKNITDKGITGAQA